jgi:urease accessory protein
MGCCIRMDSVLAGGHPHPSPLPEGEGIQTQVKTQAALLAALQLASPALPIGGFSYSQGLEAAVDVGLVRDTQHAQTWCVDALHIFAQCEAVVFCLQYAHWQSLSMAELQAQNDWFYASRETHELRLETQQMGWSMVKLITQNHWGSGELQAALTGMNAPTLTTAFAAACVALAIPLPQALAAYAFSWAENQVAAAVKSVPLGQQAGQTVLNAVRIAMPPLLALAQSYAAQSPPKINTFSPHLAVLSSRHETQYSRLFRS